MDTYPIDFYEQDTKVVARHLLGSYLVRNTENGISENGIMLGKITEVEAYLGESDHACHAFVGKTDRTRIFWGKPGIAYVFLIYGIYHCLNAITMPEGKAGCVLIRAVEPLSGVARMVKNRHRSSSERKGLACLTNGPGKLCQALAIDRSLNGTDLTNPNSPLYIARGESSDSQNAEIKITKRIGITKAAEQPLRYVLKTTTSSVHP